MDTMETALDTCKNCCRWNMKRFILASIHYSSGPIDTTIVLIVSLPKQANITIDGKTERQDTIIVRNKQQTVDDTLS